MKRLIKIVFICVLTICCSSQIHADSEIIEDTVSDYIIVMEQESGRILSAKNEQERMYPASMTKMLTCILAMEYFQDLDTTITMTNQMWAGLIEANASVAGFPVGSTPTVRDLLYGTALPSGADAANALAYTISGSVPAYVQAMNEKAQEIGMLNSHFVNVTGLHDDNHYSTAYDIALLLKYCLENPLFTEVFSARTYHTTLNTDLEATSSRTMNEYDLVNDAFIGGKTGFTYEAGHCMASWSIVNNNTYLVVTAHGGEGMTDPTHIEDLIQIDQNLQNYETKTFLQEGDVIKTVTIQNKFSSEEIDVCIPEEIQTLCKIDSTFTFKTDIEDTYFIQNEDQVIYYQGVLFVDGVETKLYHFTITIPKDTNWFTRLLRSIFGN